MIRSLNIVILCAIIALWGCESDGDVRFREEAYGGYFIRSTADDGGTPIKVNITFMGNVFSGTSDHPAYPLICTGSYTIEGNKITFKNICDGLGDDSTLVLSGDYIVNVDRDQVKLYRDYDGKQSDTYIITRLKL